MIKRLLIFILLFFYAAATKGQGDPILVTETTVKVAGLATENLYFGFQKGDKIIVNIEVVKGKDLKEFEIFQYPNSSIFMDFKSKRISDKRIDIESKGIYQFKFKNSAMSIRIVKFKIERVPASQESADFNTTVYWKTLTDTSFYTVQEQYLIRKEHLPKTIIPTTEYYINSGSNATFEGGKSRITFPVTLPKNTVNWYYQFSATRSEEEIAKTMSTFDLAGQLTYLIDQTGAMKFGLDALSQPPGADYCDIYLLDHQNSRSFESKVQYSYYTEGTRENIKSGIVKMNNGAELTYYIGVKNPDPLHGVHVGIEVVAVVLNEEWGIKDVQKYNVKSWKEPYLN